MEQRYHLSSLPPVVEAFARAARSHRDVENKPHWVLDVWFREDQSRARAGHAAAALLESEPSLYFPGLDR